MSRQALDEQLKIHALLRPVAMRAAAAVIVCGLVMSRGAVAVGCPFCGVVGESLAQRRDRAARVAVAEADGAAEPDRAAGLLRQPFLVRQMIRGETDGGGESRDVVARVPAAVEGTAIVFGDPTEAAGRLSWSAIAADEAVIGHVVAAPAVNEPAAERLAWFAKRLEHPDPVIAADAFTEFGLAAYEAVRAAAGAFDAERLRRWVRDAAGDQRRRGFYGLALGLVAATRPTEREAAVTVLRGAISAPADDFRAGFDGLVAGLLVAEGETGLRFSMSGDCSGRRHAPWTSGMCCPPCGSPGRASPIRSGGPWSRPQPDASSRHRSWRPTP